MPPNIATSTLDRLSRLLREADASFGSDVTTRALRLWAALDDMGVQIVHTDTIRALHAERRAMEDRLADRQET